MKVIGRFDRRSGEFIDPSLTGSPMLMSFGLSEIALPLVVGALTSAGVGAATAGTIASVATPALIQAGVGAGMGALTGGNPGTGAILGAMSGGLGPLNTALGGASGAMSGMGAKGAMGALNSVIGAPGQDTAGMAAPGTSQGALNNNTAYGIGDGSGGITPDAGATQPTGSPLAQSSSGISKSLSGPMAILAALAQNANRPATTAPQAPGFNTPFNADPSAYLNRQPTSPGGSPSSYYSYGQRPPAQFYSGNQLHFAHGGALSRAMMQHEMASGGKAFSTGSGDNHVRGPGGAQDDLIPARLSNDEYVVDGSTLSRLGDGSSSEGAKKMDELRRLVAHDAGAKQVVQNKTKSPLEYLREVA